MKRKALRQTGLRHQKLERDFTMILPQVTIAYYLLTQHIIGMTVITRPAFVEGVSRLALRAVNPEALAADLRGDGYRDEDAACGARHHLVDPARNIHVLVYTSTVSKFFAPSWSTLRPVITGLAERGQVR